jgi:hypothetical protein
MEKLARRRRPDEESEENAPVRNAHRYLSKRSGQLDYKTALVKGLPVGSGLIESGHRHVLQARLKILGAWWQRPCDGAVARMPCQRPVGLPLERINSHWIELHSR